MPHIFCTDNPQVNTSDDPRHIIIYRNRNTAESVRDQTPPSGRRMCSFIPCFPHFRGILFIHQFYFYILFMLLQEHHRPLLHLFMMSAVSHHNDGSCRYYPLFNVPCRCFNNDCRSVANKGSSDRHNILCFLW